MKLYIKQALLLFLFTPKLLFGQCNFTTPSPITKVNYANREVTFSDCFINDKRTNLIKVQKGESVDIKVNMKVSQNGNYCPACIVQIYWGINNYVSKCAVSFYGYSVSPMVTTQKFKAPNKDGVYYITMGGSLEYSCKNNIQRPVCDPNSAFAVLIVGTPEPEKKMTLNRIENTNYLETTLLKSGCFGLMEELKWYRNGTRIENQTTARITLNAPGTYRAIWKNCVGDSVYLDKKVDGPITIIEDKNSLDYQIEHSNKFILNKLEFALQSAVLEEDSKKELGNLVKILKEKPSMTILLEGHTEIAGSPNANLKLSVKRVNATKKYLLSKGIRQNRISAIGYGGTRPLSKGASREEQSANRRVEVVILTR